MITARQREEKMREKENMKDVNKQLKKKNTT